MKKYIWIFVCIIWIAVIGHSAYTNLWHVGDDSTYTTANDTAYDSQTDTVFVTDNVDHSGFVYSIGPSCNIKAIFSADDYAEETYCDELLYKGGELYTLIYGKTKLNNQTVKAYSFIQLDPVSLKPLAHSNWFRTFEGGEIHSISKDDNNFYAAEISSDDMQARVYAIPVDSMKEVAKGDDNNIRNVSTIRYSASVEPSEGYYFVYASYENGQISTMENGNGLIDDEVFDPYAAQRFEHKRFTPAQIVIINKHRVHRYVLAVLAGILFILSLTFFLRQRNRVAYLIALWEVMLAIVLGFSVDKLVDWNNRTDWSEVLRFVSFTVSDVRADLDELESQFENTEHYYRSEDFRAITKRLRQLVENYGNGEVLNNVLSITLLDNNEYHVVASAKGINNCSLDKLYGDEAVDLAADVHEYGASNTSKVAIDGRTYSLVCVGEKDNLSPSSLLMAVVDQAGSDELAGGEIAWVITLAVLLFIFGSIVGILILRRQAKDLRLLGNTMMNVSQGGVGIKKPKTLGEDMSDMWSGLMDIDRNIKNLNYIKYRTFEAYYKFAPKSVERLLNKTSITEVSSGDIVRKKGTIVLIDTSMNNLLLGMAKIDPTLDRIDVSSQAKEILGLISKYQEENVAYKISVASDMSEMDMVMPEDANKACEVGIELSHAYGKVGNGVCIFMHYTDYIYGVTIAEDEATQYLLSADMMRIKSRLPLLNELKLSMVVTGAVLDREMDKPSSRYIGYWLLGNDNRLDLYEILDACPDEIRHMREETLELFSEGIELFYDSNYYLARNNFAKVIKLDHSDAVARWYLFTCEKHLDGTLKVGNYELSE